MIYTNTDIIFKSNGKKGKEGKIVERQRERVCVWVCSSERR
jgi:hypothetical protein